MAFTNRNLTSHDSVGSGYAHAGSLSVSDSRIGTALAYGHFVQYKDSKLENIDTAASQVVVGVLLAPITRSMSNPDTVDTSLTSQVEVARRGLVTVEVATGQTPTPYSPVMVSNTAGSLGKAVTSGGLAISADFISEVSTGVWLIELK